MNRFQQSVVAALVFASLVAGGGHDSEVAHESEDAHGSEDAHWSASGHGSEDAHGSGDAHGSEGSHGSDGHHHSSAHVSSVILLYMTLMSVTIWSYAKWYKCLNDTRLNYEILSLSLAIFIVVTWYTQVTTVVKIHGLSKHDDDLLLIELAIILLAFLLITTLVFFTTTGHYNRLKALLVIMGHLIGFTGLTAICTLQEEFKHRGEFFERDGGVVAWLIGASVLGLIVWGYGRFIEELFHRHVLVLEGYDPMLDDEQVEEEVDHLIHDFEVETVALGASNPLAGTICVWVSGKTQKDFLNPESNISGAKFSTLLGVALLISFLSVIRLYLVTKYVHRRAERSSASISSCKKWCLLFSRAFMDHLAAWLYLAIGGYVVTFQVFQERKLAGTVIVAYIESCAALLYLLVMRGISKTGTTSFAHSLGKLTGVAVFIIGFNFEQVLHEASHSVHVPSDTEDPSYVPMMIARNFPLILSFIILPGFVFGIYRHTLNAHQLLFCPNDTKEKAFGDVVDAVGAKQLIQFPDSSRSSLVSGQSSTSGEEYSASEEDEIW